ncbi:MAG: tetraacyldisaccharide 4'-kinase [Gammaproteobacteria bacterium]
MSAPWSEVLSPLLVVPGVIFELLVRARNGLYSREVLRQRRLGRPVISIGNLSLGGSGKTPVVIYLARMLREQGAIPALLSRGYGRLSRKTTHIVAPDPVSSTPVSAVGDEPALVRRYVPNIWLGISANRYEAGRQILQSCPSVVFIMDDGFQHRRLHRDLDVVVIDQTQPLESDRVFPRGGLREPLNGLRRADLVLINGARCSSDADPVQETVRRIHPGAKIFHCIQRIRSTIPWEHWRESRNSAGELPKHASAFLVAAVGNPRRFQSDIRALGIQVAGTRFFRDHQELTERDWRECGMEARQSGAGVLITTEKDAIKLARPPEFPLLVSVQSTEVEPRDEFAELVRKIIGGAG